METTPTEPTHLNNAAPTLRVALNYAQTHSAYKAFVVILLWRLSEILQAPDIARARSFVHYINNCFGNLRTLQVRNNKPIEFMVKGSIGNGKLLRCIRDGLELWLIIFWLNMPRSDIMNRSMFSNYQILLFKIF